MVIVHATLTRESSFICIVTIQLLQYVVHRGGHAWGLVEVQNVSCVAMSDF